MVNGGRGPPGTGGPSFVQASASASSSSFLLLPARVPSPALSASRHAFTVSSSLLIRDAVPADHAAIVAINDAAVPQVNALEPTYFAWLVANSALFRVAVDSEGIAGFHLCLASGGEYW